MSGLVRRMLVETESCRATHMSVLLPVARMRPRQQRAEEGLDTYGELVASYVAKIRVCLGG